MSSEQQASNASANPTPNTDGLQQVDAPVFYVSGVATMGTGNDFILTFSRPMATFRKDGGELTTTIVENVVVLQMSPQTAKDLSVAITQAVASHENHFGALNTPFTKGLKAGG